MYLVYYLLNDCCLIVGSECEYVCSDNFIKNVNVFKIKCLLFIEWSYNVFDVCK